MIKNTLDGEGLWRITRGPSPRELEDERPGKSPGKVPEVRKTYSICLEVTQVAEDHCREGARSRTVWPQVRLKRSASARSPTIRSLDFIPRAVGGQGRAFKPRNNIVGLPFWKTTAAAPWNVGFRRV